MHARLCQCHSITLVTLNRFNRFDGSKWANSQIIVFLSIKVWIKFNEKCFKGLCIHFMKRKLKYSICWILNSGVNSPHSNTHGNVRTQRMWLVAKQWRNIIVCQWWMWTLECYWCDRIRHIERVYSDRDGEKEIVRYITGWFCWMDALNEFHKQIHLERSVVSQRRTLSPLCCV